MDIIIEIQGFRNVNEKFIPKEVAVVAINAIIIGHWIMISLCPFSDLSKRKQLAFAKFMALSELTVKSISNISRYNYAKLHGKHAYIPEDKKKLVIYANYSLEMYII